MKQPKWQHVRTILIMGLTHNWKGTKKIKESMKEVRSNVRLGKARNQALKIDGKDVFKSLQLYELRKYDLMPDDWKECTYYHDFHYEK